jgi:tryptophan halogenase
MQVKSILIAGGGSSGWMTAALLSKYLPDIKITLIESAHIPIIGVGESTLAGINTYLSLLGLKDEDWMHRCNATYKTAIRFSDFNEKDYHQNDNLQRLPPKGKPFPVEMHSVYEFFLLCGVFPDRIKIEDFANFFDDNHHMTETNKFSHKLPIGDWNFSLDKAYHMDAYKFGATLKELIAIPNGVQHIVDDIVAIASDDDGIKGLVTLNNGTLVADLYVDCTGFKSLLSNEVGSEFTSTMHTNVNDSAWNVNIPYVDKENEMTAYTNCTAIENGWVWNIPTWDRMGSGYVFSSKFVDNDTALEEYKNHLRSVYGDDRVDQLDEPRLIKFTPGYRKTPFKKNVVAIGLAAGFIEPLRSTGILMTHEAIIQLLNLLVASNANIKSIDRSGFNRIIATHYYNQFAFVSMHYCLAKRCDTPYWKHVTQDVEYVDDSTPHLSIENIYKDLFYWIFEDNPTPTYSASILRIMTLMGYKPAVTFKELDEVKKDGEEYFRLKTMLDIWIRRKNIINAEIDKMPSVYEYTRKRIYNED